jgi:hypothetical protein
MSDAPRLPPISLVRFLVRASADQYRFKLSAIPFRAGEDCGGDARSVNARKILSRVGDGAHEKGP